MVPVCPLCCFILISMDLQSEINDDDDDDDSFRKVQNGYIFLPLFGLTPRRRGSPGTISVKFYLDVVRSPTY